MLLQSVLKLWKHTVHLEQKSYPGQFNDSHPAHVKQTANTHNSFARTQYMHKQAAIINVYILFPAALFQEDRKKKNLTSYAAACLDLMSFQQHFNLKDLISTSL